MAPLDHPVTPSRLPSTSPRAISASTPFSMSSSSGSQYLPSAIDSSHFSP